jgi:hypothetical protein
LSGTTLTVRLLENVKAKAVAALLDDATDVLRFLGLPEDSDVRVETEDA